jgi:hypothetical protein
MPFTPPNRYWPRPDWKPLLEALGGLVGTWQAPLNSFQFDLLTYQQNRGLGMSLMKAWIQVKMSPEHAKKSLLTAPPAANNLSGLVPPNLFSRVLARSRATKIDPNDDAADAIVEKPPEGAVAEFKALASQAAPAQRKTAKRKTSKRKPAKSVKRKAAKRKVATRRSGRHRRMK